MTSLQNAKSEHNSRGGTSVSKESKSKSKMQPLKYDPVYRDFEVSLEEFMSGCLKFVPITRKVIDHEGNEKMEKKVINLDIKPGAEAGDEFLFERHGDASLGDQFPADVIFVLKEKPHELFKRRSADLLYTATITKEEALHGFTRNIPSLELEHPEIRVEMNEPEKGMVKIIPGHGLPFPNYPTRRGNLLVNFKIDPKDLPKLPPHRFELPVPLETILKGGVEKLQFRRTISMRHGEKQFEDVTFEIVIIPGMQEGTEITRWEEGDCAFGVIPADVTFVIRYKAHDLFRPNGPNIEYTARIDKSKTKFGSVIRIPYLASKKIFHFIVKKKLTNGYILKINNKGLPYANDPAQRGQLVVRFEIENDGLLGYIKNYFSPKK